MATGCHLGFDPTGNGAVRSAFPRKSYPRTKNEVDRMTCCWVMAIWSLSHSGRRTADTGYRISDTRDCKWFYILSNAAMQCTGQTI